MGGSKIGEAKQRGFLPMVRFNSVGGFKNRIVTELVEINGDIFSKANMGCIYDSKTDTWGEIIK